MLDETIADTPMTPDEYDARHTVWLSMHRLADAIVFAGDRVGYLEDSFSSQGHRSDLREVLRLLTGVPDPLRAGTIYAFTELDELPVGTVIRGAKGGVWEVSEEVTDGTELRYIGVGGNDFFQSRILLELYGPVHVIWSPTLRTQTQGAGGEASQ